LSSPRRSRRGALGVLERVGELVKFGRAHAEAASHGAPLRHGLLDRPEDLARSRRGNPEIGQHRHERLDRRLGSRILRDPGLQLPGSLRERIDVKGGREPPLTPVDVQEAMVAQMVVDIADEDGEGDPWVLRASTISV